jgi:hypothetical protein
VSRQGTDILTGGHAGDLQKDESVMLRLRNMGLVLGLIGGLAVPVSAAEMPPIKQEAKTAHYRLELQIGPTEQMFTPSEAAAQHPTEGEVMVSGMMSMGMSMDVGDTRHLEVHLYSLDKGETIADADVAIAVTDAASMKVQDVGAAKMYGVKEGPSDTHYGDNGWGTRRVDEDAAGGGGGKAGLCGFCFTRLCFRHCVVGPSSSELLSRHRPDGELDSPDSCDYTGIDLNQSISINSRY